MARGFKTLPAVVAAGMIMTVSLVSGPAAATTDSASFCPRPKVRNADTGYAIMMRTVGLKAGPYAGSRCRTVGQARLRQVLYLHCWVKNSYGKWWAYGRLKGTSLHGWTSVDNLYKWRTDGTPHCEDEDHRD